MRKKIKNTYIWNLKHPDYRLKHFIPVILNVEGDQVIADCYPLDMYGCGSSKEKAISDLREVIVEYYESLKKDKDKLGPIPKKHWIYLEKSIIKTDRAKER